MISDPKDPNQNFTFTIEGAQVGGSAVGFLRVLRVGLGFTYWLGHLPQINSVFSDKTSFGLIFYPISTS